MSPYQRGNRDGLRSLAASLRVEEERLTVYLRDLVQRAADARNEKARGAMAILAAQTQAELGYLVDTILPLVERAAEALPDDPEPDSGLVPKRV